MTDPRFTGREAPARDPLAPPPRGPYQRDTASAAPWIMTVVAAIVVIAAIAWGMNHLSNAANNAGPATTTGQSSPPAGDPAPATRPAPGGPVQGAPRTNP
jgi:hypothetical protein